MSKKRHQEIKKWDDLGVPYCLYCFKQLEGRAKYNKQKFCCTDHRDKHKMIRTKTLQEERPANKRTCEYPTCDNELTEHQFKYCSPRCRKQSVQDNKKTRPICAFKDCKKKVPLGNKKFCSMKCSGKEKSRKATEERDSYWITISCRNCAKTFEKTRAQADKFHNKFCSQLCYIEWQHAGTDNAGSRFMWKSDRNPQHSKKGVIEHYDRSVRNYLIELDKKPEIVKWEFPIAKIQIGPGIDFMPTVIVEYSNGTKKAIEIAERGQAMPDRNPYRWQMIQFHCREADVSIEGIEIVYTDQIKEPS